VKQVIDAAYRDHLDVTLANLFIAVNRAQRTRTTRDWALDIEQEVPGVAQGVDELSNAAFTRVAAVKVATPAGARFRAMMLHGLQRQAASYRGLARDLATGEATTKVVRRWAGRFNALQRWYAHELALVVVAAPIRDQAAVRAALTNY
jgi:hypothetical protein